MGRWVYFFGPGVTDQSPGKEVLGGKGESLAWMSRSGLPIPPGFTISTECCRLFLDAGGKWPAGLQDEIRSSTGRLKKGIFIKNLGGFGKSSDHQTVPVRQDFFVFSGMNAFVPASK